MKTQFRADGETTHFMITELKPAYHEIVRGLYYTPFEEGFAKHYPSDTPYLARIYQRFERYAEEMIMQAAGLRPVPWEKALHTFLASIESTSIAWRLAGSVGLALRGIEVAPRDIDLVVDNASAQQLGEVLLAYLVEPVIATTGWIANWFGRAFMAARVEWVGVEDPYAVAGLEVIEWQDQAIHVPLLEMHLEEDRQRGLTERAAKIAQYLREHKK